MNESFDWDMAIDEAVAALPERFRIKIQNVAVLLDDDPSEELLEQEGLASNETLLGIYQGIPLSERGEGYGIGETVPDTITLFKNPIQLEAGETDGDVVRVIRETIWHEFGHYFGLDEHEVRKRENERDLRK